jgi:hypothetical protein
MDMFAIKETKGRGDVGGEWWRERKRERTRIVFYSRNK